MYYVKRCPRKTRTRITRLRTAHAAGRWRASSASGGASGSASSGRVRMRVVVRASGSQRGCIMRGSVRVCERVVVSASGQAAKAARKSRDEIRLG